MSMHGPWRNVPWNSKALRHYGTKDAASLPAFPPGKPEFSPWQEGAFASRPESTWPSLITRLANLPLRRPSLSA